LNGYAFIYGQSTLIFPSLTFISAFFVTQLYLKV
jgi:hypothetical protein